MSDMVKALGMALGSAGRQERGEPAPVACCPNDREPLVMTLEYPGAEFLCWVCGHTFGDLDPTEGDPTPELLARAAELKAAYRADYRRRHPNDYPVDLSTVDFDRPPTVHDWARSTIAWVGPVGVPLVDGYRVDGETEQRVKDAWRTTWDDPRELRDHHDPVGLQRVAAEVYEIARTNPGNLPPLWLAGWQKHAAEVARGCRAEYCRERGGTGAELKVIEGAGLSFPDAQEALRVIEEIIDKIETEQATSADHDG